MPPFLARRPSPLAPACRARGFALLVTIVLVAFLVLILVGLATFTRVETQVAANGQSLAGARQNALVALNVALGQLQTYAGPDQRATGTAGLETAASDGARHWTAVWGDSANPLSDPAGSPVRLQWLVSGNERTAFDPSTQVSTAAADFGRIITAPAAPAFIPASVVSGLAANSTPESAITIGGATPAALLVGAKTAGSLADYVVAPLVELTAPAASVPGADPSGDPIAIGRYAYWVGDEGVKARADLVDPYATPTAAMIAGGATAAPASPLRLMAPQRQAIERVAGLGDFPVNTDAVRRVLDFDQISFVAPTIAVADRRARFHDITTDSVGVLADQRRGGLKRDLTFAFAQTLPNYRTALGLTGASSNPLLPTATMPAAEQGPTWEQLHSYGNLDGSSAIAPRRHTATQHGIHPILVQARLGLGGENILDGANSHFILRISPAVVLANPYNVALAAKLYRVRLTFNAPSDVSAFIGNTATPFWRMPIRELFEGQTFEVDCPRLEPGEALVFTLATDNDPWAAVKTYRMEPDWSDFSITLNTLDHGGSPFDETVIDDYPNPDPEGTPAMLRAKGVHPVFGDGVGATAPPGVWSSTFAGPLLNNTSGGTNRGGELNWALLDTDNTIFQHIETLGYASNVASQYGIRGVGVKKTGGSFLYMASASNFSATTAFPYFSQYNFRAPLISRTAYYFNRINALTSWNLSFQINFERWLRLVNPANPSDPRVQWTGAVGAAGQVPLGRGDWQAFDVPRSATGLVSLGQLQHANFAGHVDGLAYPAPASPLSSRPSSNTNWRPRYITPTYALGNSRAHLHVAPDATKQTINAQPYYDLSFLLNRELFDGYFFSTYPQTGSVNLASARLRNPRLQPFRPDILPTDTASYRGGASFAAGDARLAARNLVLNGAFNVNSTSAHAWRALLSALRGIDFNGATNLEGPFVRSIHQSAGSAQNTNLAHADAWNGFRNLSDTQINLLADEIVAQIRARGPALSLSDFVNRKLDDTVAAHAHAGPLQAAIDATSAINDSFPTTVETAPGNTITLTTPADTRGTNGNLFYHYPDHAPKHAFEGVAGWLSQADVLQALAPVLAARSDTFRIRAYGESLNPATGDTQGRAWCEAIVQRLPDHVATADDATVAPADLTQTDNRRFGRRFVVVGFRWLGRDDI